MSISKRVFFSPRKISSSSGSKCTKIIVSQANDDEIDEIAAKEDGGKVVVEETKSFVEFFKFSNDTV